MIDKKSIHDLVSNHVPPHMYQSGFKKGVTPIFYSGQYWDNKETEAVLDAFLNGKWLVSGEHVREFENKFSQMFHSEHSLMVNSGSSANLVLIASLKKYFKWADDDEIIVSPTGFPTTISVIYQNRLKPVFADIEWDTLNFDLNEVEKKITDKTRAIFLSPVLGNPPDIDRLLDICDHNRLELILDNCDSLGGKWNGYYLNQYAVGSSCSFYPAHHISTGEGGMVSTDDEILNNIMFSMAFWGRDCTCHGADNLKGIGVCGKRFSNWLKEYDGVVDHKYIFTNMGYNLKPMDLQGAIGVVQLDKFSEIRDKRNKHKEIIESIVTKIVGVKGVRMLPQADVCWFGVPFICEDKELKNKLVAHLEANKIQTRNYFAGNILLHPGFNFLDDYRKYPNANQVLDKVFFLGCAPHYSERVFIYIKEVINKL